jgi:transposase
MEKFRVTLEADERAGLERLVSAGKAASRKLTHARILLLADATQGEGHSDDEIVSALGASVNTIGRVRKRFVMEGVNAAIDHRPQPARPEKIKVKGDIEQELVKLACTDPPRGRCHWTLQLLADEMVVLGLVKSISTETVRQALKKTTSSPGSSSHGASPRRPMPSSFGGWRTYFRPTCSPTIRSGRWSVLTRRASNSLGKCVRPNRPALARLPVSTTNTSEKGSAAN